MKKPDSPRQWFLLLFYICVLLGIFCAVLLYALELILSFDGMQLSDIHSAAFQMFRETVAIVDLGATGIMAVLVALAYAWHWLKAAFTR